MRVVHSTDAVAAPHRALHWRDTIARTYFPLELTFRRPEIFSGELSVWEIGATSLSRLRSDALRYRREAHHLAAERTEHFLITIPALAEVEFAQCGQQVRCGPGGFIVERSHEPYDFSHAEANDLWVLKVPAEALAARVRAPDRFCTMRFNAMTGVGQLFVDMLRLLPERLEHLSQEARTLLGQQILDLLVLALKEDERTLSAASSSVREAHLSRVEAYVRRHLGDHRLDPERIGDAYGLSVRYLHQIFAETGQTLGQWVRDQRLLACREALADPSSREGVAEIAFRWGFSDQSQFSRAFKARFGQGPREFRDASRRGLRPHHG